MKTVSQDFFYRHKWLLVAMGLWVVVCIVFAAPWYFFLPPVVAVVAGYFNSKEMVKRKRKP